MSTTKIRIKAGNVEVDYDGDASFLKADLIKLVKELQQVSETEILSKEHHSSSQSKSKPPAGSGQLTTKSIATKLAAKSGSDLAKAAVAHLAIMKGQSQIKRIEILNEIKTASGIYKAHMSGNLTKIIGVLLNDGTIVENSTHIYSLTPEAEAKLKGQLSSG